MALKVGDGLRPALRAAISVMRRRHYGFLLKIRALSCRSHWQWRRAMKAGFLAFLIRPLTKR
ncbi:MAG: hypothetical protein EBY34_06530 [Alphaproteobacteria bacterium]|nr:hypothetical protein [Alphaproteobacteria bacterium]